MCLRRQCPATESDFGKEGSAVELRGWFLRVDVCCVGHHLPLRNAASGV